MDKGQTGREAGTVRFLTVGPVSLRVDDGMGAVREAERVLAESEAGSAYGYVRLRAYAPFECRTLASALAAVLPVLDELAGASKYHPSYCTVGAAPYFVTGFDDSGISARNTATLAAMDAPASAYDPFAYVDANSGADKNR